MNSMNDFALDGWKRETPVTGCASPVSFCGRLIGTLLTTPKRMKAAFMETRKEFAYGDMVLVALMMAVPVSLGILLICLLDYHVTKAHSRRQHQD